MFSYSLLEFGLFHNIPWHCPEMNLFERREDSSSESGVELLPVRDGDMARRTMVILAKNDIGASLSLSGCNLHVNCRGYASKMKKIKRSCMDDGMARICLFISLVDVILQQHPILFDLRIRRPQRSSVAACLACTHLINCQRHIPANEIVSYIGPLRLFSPESNGE